MHSNRRTLLAVVVLSSALALAGCAAATNTPTSGGAPTNAGQNQQQGQDRGRGVSGTIAAASAGLLQVQDASTQTAVTYTSGTTVDSRVAGTAADVTVGSCVNVTSGATGDAARSVMVSPASADGTCTGGFGGGGFGGGFGGGGNGTRPTGAPSARPSGAPTNGGNFARPVFGKVTATSADSITVDAVTFTGGRNGATATPDPSATPTLTTKSTEVSIASTTTYTKTVVADAAALVVGQCVAAQGKADTSGGFAATSLTVSAPGDNGCVTRMGGNGN